MDPRFITKEIHAYLDYPVAVGLIALPFVLGLGASHPAALWCSVVAGVAAFFLTVLTDHQFGLLRILPYWVHLAVDGLVGLSFLALPAVLGFTGLDAAFYYANGVAVAFVVLLHKPEVGPAQAPAV